MGDDNARDSVRILIPKNGIYGDPPVKIKILRICRCGEAHVFEAPNPQMGEWYTCVVDPCEHTVTYTSLWELKL